MKIGTRSVLFGVHAFWLHGFFVAEAWRRLYGFPRNWPLWASFFLHDIGYLGKTDIEGPSGEKHVYAGARVMTRLFGPAWGEFCLRHSRYWAHSHGGRLSRLAAADKLAFVLTPSWLYLPMARATGELSEYVSVSQVRQRLDDGFTESERELLASGNARSWLKALQAYTRRWVDEHAHYCSSVNEIRTERGRTQGTGSFNRRGGERRIYGSARRIEKDN
jgi:hypothetical protein